MQISQGLLPRPRREFHKLYMPISKVFEKLKAKGLLKPLDPRAIPNPLPITFDVSKRCAYHQGPGHDTNRCFNLHPAIQDVIDTKVIALPTRPSITNNPFPNHNFGRGPKINCLMSEEKGEEDPSEWFMTYPSALWWLGKSWWVCMPSAIGYDIWSEDATEAPNYPTSTYVGRHFQP